VLKKKLFIFSSGLVGHAKKKVWVIADRLARGGRGQRTKRDMEERKCSHFFLYFCPALFVVFNSLVHPY
jgi:hypothetical protein